MNQISNPVAFTSTWPSKRRYSCTPSPQERLQYLIHPLASDRRDISYTLLNGDRRSPLDLCNCPAPRGSAAPSMALVSPCQTSMATSVPLWDMCLRNEKDTVIASVLRGIIIIIVSACEYKLFCNCYNFWRRHWLSLLLFIPRIHKHISLDFSKIPYLSLRVSLGKTQGRKILILTGNIASKIQNFRKRLATILKMHKHIKHLFISNLF